MLEELQGVMDTYLVLYAHSPLVSIVLPVWEHTHLQAHSHFRAFPHAILFRVESSHSTYHPQPLCLLSIDLLFNLPATLPLLREDFLRSAGSPCITSQKTTALFLNRICKFVFMCDYLFNVTFSDNINLHVDKGLACFAHHIS